MKSRLILSACFLALHAIPASAQGVAVDAAKVTCHQFLLGKIGPTVRTFTYWLSGYYNGKEGKTVVDVGQLERNVRALSAYCRKNPETPVMDATKTVLGLDK